MLSGVTYTATQTGGASGFTANGSGAILDTAVHLPAGSSITYVATATVNPSATGTLSNTATVTAPDGVLDLVPDNNTATDSDLLTPGADLRITKTNQATSVVPGMTTTYTIVVTNVGPSDANGVQVSDAFPADLVDVTYTATQTGGASGFSPSGSGDIQDAAVRLPAGSSITYLATGMIRPSARGQLRNTATVAPPAGLIDPVLGNNTATDQDPLVPRADLQITKTNGVAALTPGTSTTYTIVVSNAGPSDVTGASVRDVFPAALTGVTFTATSSGGASGYTASGSGELHDAAVDLPVGSSITYLATGTVGLSASGTLSNTATVTPPSGVLDPVLGNNTATDQDPLSRIADLQITKTNSTTSLVPGTATTYTIVVSNAGPSDVSGASVADAFPAALTGVTYTASQTGGASGFTANGSGNILDTEVNLPSGSAITYIATGTVSPSATGTLSNTATVTPPADVADPTPGNNTATDSDALTPRADLRITKTNNASSLVPGTATTYTIVVSNAGPSDVSGASVADAFPAALTGMTYTASQTGGAGGFTASGSGNILDTAVNLPVGSAISYVATGTVNASARGTLSNTATITPPADVVDPTPGNNTATDSDPLTPRADLRITKTNNASSLVPGTATTYTIVVSNAGPSDVSGASVADAFPAALTGVTYTASQTGGASGFTASGSGNILDAAVNLPSGSAISYIATGTVSPSATGTLGNTATITPPADAVDPIPGNNTATDSDPLTPRADLRITKTNNATSLVPGTITTYTIVVSNAGPSQVAAASVRDTFPAAQTGVTYTATQTGGASGFTASGSGNILDTAVNLPVGSAITYVATGTVSPSATGTLSNTATVTPPSGVVDPAPADNTATDSDPLTPRADLRITKTNNATSLVPGTTTTYTIVVSNAGPSDVSGASVADAFPAALTGVTYTATPTGGASGFTASGSGNILDAAVNLPVGSAITYVATGTVNASATGTLSNTATITPPADVADSTPGNNTATDSDALTPRADLRITKTNNATSVVPGTTTTYTIVVTNAGPSDVSGASVADAFPAALTGVTYTATQTGGASGFTANGSGNILDAAVNLPVGSAITYVATGTISPSATGTLSNTATVTPPSGVVDPTPGNNTATDSDPLTRIADLRITKTNYATSVIPGTTTAYAIVVTNLGPNDVTGARIRDAFPTVLTGVTFTATQTGGASGFTANGTGDLDDAAVHLPAGSEITYVATGLVDPAATGTLVNTATVALPAGVSDPVPGNNTATDSDPLRPTADLQITKTNHTDSPVLGDLVTYTIVVTNGGPSSVSGATVTDVFPAALTNVTYTSTATGLASGNTPAGTGDILDTVSMAPGSTITYTASATLTRNGNGSLTNIATVTLPPGVEHPHPENGEAEDSDSLQTLIVIAPDRSSASEPWVHIVGRKTGELVTRFLAFEPSYRGGIRVTTGDLTGDGLPEIVAVRGRNATPEVRIFDLRGNLLHEFLAFPPLFLGGVHVAVGDVDGDGKNDVIAAMSYGGSQVVVFKNETTLPTSLSFRETKSFYPFGSAFKGGAVVAAADLGALEGDAFLATLDGKAEIIVGNEAGMSPTVQVFEYASLQSVRTFAPFTSAFKGGLSLDVARVNADAIPDIIVGAGPGGGSKVEVLDGAKAPKTTLLSFTAYAADETASYHAPVRVAAVDDDGDGIADVIVTAQGADGTTGMIKTFRTADLAQVSEQFPGNLPEPPDFDSAYFVAELTAAKLPSGLPIPLPPSAWTNPLLAEDVNVDGRVTALDALLVINDLNRWGPRVLMGSPPANFLPDVDASGSLEPADVLRVIRALNAAGTAAGGEGEASAEPGQPFADAAGEAPWPSLGLGLPAGATELSRPVAQADRGPRSRPVDRTFAELGRQAAELRTARSQRPQRPLQTATGELREFSEDDEWLALADDVCRTWESGQR